MKLLIAGGVIALLALVRNSRRRRRLAGRSLTAKVLAITLAVAWAAALFAVLFVL